MITEYPDATMTMLDSPSTRSAWVGRIIRGLVILFLLFSVVAHLVDTDSRAGGVANAVSSESRVMCLGAPVLFHQCGAPYYASSYSPRSP